MILCLVGCIILGCGTNWLVGLGSFIICLSIVEAVQEINGD